MKYSTQRSGPTLEMEIRLPFASLCSQAVDISPRQPGESDEIQYATIWPNFGDKTTFCVSSFSGCRKRSQAARNPSQHSANLI